LAKAKQYELIADWIKSITNQLYWCAASVPDGEGDEIVKRWKSLMNHVCNTHDDCYHDPLYSLEDCGLCQVLSLFLANMQIVAMHRKQSKQEA